MHQCPSQVSQRTGRGKEEVSGCVVYWIHQGTNPGISAELKGLHMAAVQVAVQMGLGHKSHQVQSPRQGYEFWFFSQKELLKGFRPDLPAGKSSNCLWGMDENKRQMRGADVVSQVRDDGCGRTSGYPAPCPLSQLCSPVLCSPLPGPVAPSTLPLCPSGPAVSASPPGWFSSALGA